ncbi:hypothetical protein RND71_023612 [Anisodus tanguticus]|uniref:Purple acid phosphatase n=1 Tax=Anisodus tanguticus TaxID=243964 RepID=A0AAE1RV64_9SOLA|nr:hypothetical protein RND71_023612 [Anisodus tanguticus]
MEIQEVPISLLSISSTLTSVRADLVDDVCSKTQKPAICLSALRADPRSKGANLEGLATISIDISLKNAKSTRDLVNTLLKQATDPKLKTRYDSCLENYNDAVDDLGELPSFLKSKDYDGLNIHASAVSDDPSTCDDNFSGPPAESPQLKAASDKFQGFEVTCSSPGAASCKNAVYKVDAMKVFVILLPILWVLVALQGVASHEDHPLARIAVHKAIAALDARAYIKASPSILGSNGLNREWITLEYGTSIPSNDDWVGVFSPGNFSAATCDPEYTMVTPFLCTAPIKVLSICKSLQSQLQKDRKRIIKASIDQPEIRFLLRFVFWWIVKLSNTVAFANPNAPLYPRLAQGKTWNEMTVTWTSGYAINEAEPFVEWGPQGGQQTRSPAGTLTFDRSSLCGGYSFPSCCVLKLVSVSRAPARTVGWRNPGFIHTSFLKELWPNLVYTYKLGHKMVNGKYIWSQMYNFKSSPYPGQNSLQRVVIFGDMGKWDQFTSQVEPITSRVPYMIASGNHERDWPDSGSFYGKKDSGGECGVLAQTMFYFPADNRDKFWYSTDYGMFRFCIADTEHDWREGTEQYKFIEHCFASVDRQKQPWLIFLAHWVLGYSSGDFYADEGSFGEPMGRESLQKLWQKYKVDIAIYGHVHNYERTCPIYQDIENMMLLYLSPSKSLPEKYLYNEREEVLEDYDYGFVKMTAFDHSNLLFEYKKSRDGIVYDSFNISQDYRDILACTVDSCPSMTLAS